MKIELKKNRRSGKRFILCDEKDENVIVSCPDGIIRTLPGDFFDESSSGEAKVLIEGGSITAKQYAAFLRDKEMREKDPVMAAIDFQVEEMTPDELASFIQQLEAIRGKK